MFRNKEKRNKLLFNSRSGLKILCLLKKEGNMPCINLPCPPFQSLQVLKTQKLVRSKRERKSWSSRRRKSSCRKNSWKKSRSLRRSVCGRLWVSSAFGGLVTLCLTIWSVSVIPLSILSCFTGAHRQNAKRISAERRWETASCQKACRHRVQIGWQPAAKWTGMSTSSEHFC